MRIISSFRDYYDQHDYTENDDIYLRETKEIIEAPDNYSRNGVRIDQIAIGFCGEIYPLIKMSIIKTIHQPHHEVKTFEEFFYSKNEFKTKDKYKDDDLIQYGDVWPSDPPVAFYEKDLSKYKKIFVEHGVPIFVSYINNYREDESSLILNPILSYYKFGKIKDAQTAYQDIDMFISGVLGNKEVTVEIEDKYRIQAHGYNEESFRMPKGIKKPRRKGK